MAGGTLRSRALTALSNQNLELNVITREWQEKSKTTGISTFATHSKWGRISRERGFARAARCGSNNSLILFKATSASRAVTFIARVMGASVAGCCSACAFYLHGVRKC